MGVPARAKVEIREFPGLQSRVDPDDLGPGASSEQVNAQGHHPMELRVRPGVVELSFEEE